MVDYLNDFVGGSGVADLQTRYHCVLLEIVNQLTQLLYFNFLQKYLLY